MKLYVIFGGALLAVLLLVSGFVYVRNVEQKIKELELQNQANQIEIETNRAVIDKQNKTIQEYNKHQQKLKQIALDNQKKQEELKKKLEEADLIEEKKEMFENILTNF